MIRVLGMDGEVYSGREKQELAREMGAQVGSSHTVFSAAAEVISLGRIRNYWFLGAKFGGGGHPAATITITPSLHHPIHPHHSHDISKDYLSFQSREPEVFRNEGSVSEAASDTARPVRNVWEKGN